MGLLGDLKKKPKKSSLLYEVERFGKKKRK